MRPRFKTAFFPFLAAVFLAVFQGEAHAGAWLQEKGHGLLIVSTTMLSGDKIFDAAGRPFSIPRYNRFDADAWLEYGLTDRFTLVLQPALRSVRVSKPYDINYTGFGDSSFGARIGLWSSGDTVFSLQPMVRVPGGPLLAGMQVQTEIRLLYGHSYWLGAWPAFIDTEFAYRFGGGVVADEIHSDVTLGVRPRPDTMVMAQMLSTFAFIRAEGFYASGREYKAVLSAVWDFAENWSLQVGGIATLAGANALQERGYFAAIWKRF
jgi:hypothetical protein